MPELGEVPVGALDLDALPARVELPDLDAVAATRAAVDALERDLGPLGRLAEVAVWLSGCQGASPPRPLERVRALVLAGTHGIAASASRRSTPETADAVRRLVDGSSPVVGVCEQLEVGLRVLDVAVDADLDLAPDVTARKLARGSRPFDREDAVDRETAEAALAVGAAVADEEVDAGADLLVVSGLGAGSEVAADVLVALLTRSDVVDVLPRADGTDDARWMRRAAAVRDGGRRGRPLVPDRVGLLAAVGGADLAAVTGVLAEAAARRTPVVLDGPVAAAAALVAQRLAHRAPRWQVAGARSPAPAQRLALDRLDLVPLLEDLGPGSGIDAQGGLGGLLAVPFVRAASGLLAPGRVRPPG